MAEVLWLLIVFCYGVGFGGLIAYWSLKRYPEYWRERLKKWGEARG